MFNTRTVVPPGAGSGLVPMYLTEISPVNFRGAMGVLHQFALTCGILVSQIIGIRQILGKHIWLTFGKSGVNNFILATISLILKVKDIAIFAAKNSIVFQKLDMSAKSVLYML